jgi:hypothetical protein
MGVINKNFDNLLDYIPSETVTNNWNLVMSNIDDDFLKLNFLFWGATTESEQNVDIYRMIKN